jgi:hypothetical protein
MAAVAALAADERGVLLGVLQGGGAPERLAGPGAERCRAALISLADLSEDERARERDALVAALAEPLPASLARVHPGWLRRALEAEPSPILRAAAAGLADEVVRVADEILRGRGDAPVERESRGPGVAALRRALFAALEPMPNAHDGPRRAGELCALPFEALAREIDRRGAVTLGLALAGAPDAALARAAAGVGEPLARVVIASAKGGAGSEARAEARAAVARVPAAEAARGAARAVGLRVVARSLLEAEGAAALAAVAQRLPPAMGDALLACTREARSSSS